MLILVAIAAVRRQPHPCAAQILIRQQSPLRSGDMLRRVARAAAYANMLAVERIAGLRVIKSPWRGVPVDHLKIRPVVIGVAFHAR